MYDSARGLSPTPNKKNDFFRVRCYSGYIYATSSHGSPLAMALSPFNDGQGVDHATLAKSQR